MKIRSLHPSFFSDAKVCRLSPTARVLFAGLWCYADDYGRGKWLPKSIEGAVFPRDVVDIQTLLNEVLRAGLIRIFTDGTDDFYEVPSWDEYQSPKYRGKTDVPDPETLENPYRSGPGQFSPTLGESSLDLSQGVGVGVGEGVGEGVGVIAPQRERNQVWDALAEIFGEPETRTSRSLRGKVCKSLTEADANAAEVFLRVQAWPMLFPDATLTDIALEKHWTALGRPALRASEQDVTKHKRDLELQLAQEEWERERKAIGQ